MSDINRRAFLERRRSRFEARKASKCFRTPESLQPRLGSPPATPRAGYPLDSGDEAKMPSVGPGGGLPARPTRIRVSHVCLTRGGLPRLRSVRACAGQRVSLSKVLRHELRLAGAQSVVRMRSPRAGKPPHRLARSFKTHASRCSCGSGRCGPSPRRRMGPAPWIYSAFWDWAVTKPPGLGCTS